MVALGTKLRKNNVLGVQFWESHNQELGFKLYQVKEKSQCEHWSVISTFKLRLKLSSFCWIFINVFIFHCAVFLVSVTLVLWINERCSWLAKLFNLNIHLFVCFICSSTFLWQLNTFITACIKSGWNKLRDLVSLLASGCLPFWARGRYFAFVCRIMLFESESWRFKEENVIRLQRNDPRMFRWVCNVRPQHRISTKELKIRLNLNKVGNFYRIKDYSDLVIRKKCKRMLSLLNKESSRLVLVSSENYLRKHGMR